MQHFAETEELGNEVDKFIHEHVNSKEKQKLYQGKPFSEQKRIFFEVQFVPPDKKPEEIVSKFHNCITHTAKVIQTSSGVHLCGKKNAPVPEGYVTLSSTATREDRDYGGAAMYASKSKVMESKINETEKFKDLLLKKDIKLKDFLGFDDNQWGKLIEVNRLSDSYYAEPKPDSFAKQVLFYVGSGKYLNFTITPSPILLYEVDQRIKERIFGEDERESFGQMAVKKIGGANPLNASRLISKLKHLRVLSGTPFFIQRNQDYIERLIRSTNFFQGIGYVSKIHEEPLLLFKKFLDLNEAGRHNEGAWRPNAKVQNALNNSFANIIELTFLTLAIQAKSLGPGWSDNKLIKIPDYQKKWLDPENPSHDPFLDYKERVAKDMLYCVNRLFQRFSKIKQKQAVDLTQDEYFWRFLEIIKRSL